MTPAISMLKNIFLLHTKTQDYHLIIPMRYSKRHNVDLLALKEVTCIDEWNLIDN